ncbi:MAG: HEPN domain-containing protein [Kiritimatiellales bacterium]
MDKYFRAKRNDLIKESFRDTADHDYIAARACARLELLDQFLWSALHALEKYLKAIILFHDGKADKGHDLVKAVNKIRSLKCHPFEIDPATEEFFEYLTRYGQDRYSIRPRGTLGDELLKLDDAVWSVRRFCQDLHWLEQQNPKQYSAYIADLTASDRKQNAVKFRLLHKGYLEEVLDTDKHPAQREQLVWKNFRYGGRKKNLIKNFKRSITRKIPALYRSPELYPWAKDHVYLSKEEKHSIEEHIKNDGRKTCGTIK